MDHPIPQDTVTGLLQEIPAAPGTGGRAQRRREARRLRRQLYPEKRRAARRRYRARRHQREREQVFAHYGTSCACCGAADRLTIDHVAGDGAEHRRAMGNRGGYRTYRWLIANGFPAGFQTLCEPCNLSKGRKPACRLGHVNSETGAALYTPAGLSAA